MNKKPTFLQFLESTDVDQIASLASSNTDFGDEDGDDSRDGKEQQLKGSLTNTQQRVLALLMTDQLKQSPGRARELLTGDDNVVQAVRSLKTDFDAVDVAPGTITINSKGIQLAQNAGLADANTGALTQLGKQLISKNTAGSQNQKAADLSGGGAPTAPSAAPTDVSQLSLPAQQ